MLSLKNIFSKKEVMTPEEEALIEQYTISPEVKQEQKKIAEEEISKLAEIIVEDTIEQNDLQDLLS
jgi:hypothetical protein